MVPLNACEEKSSISDWSEGGLGQGEGQGCGTLGLARAAGSLGLRERYGRSSGGLG